MAEVGRDPVVFLHDGTFEGFLTTVFEATRLKLPVAWVQAAASYRPGLFEQCWEVETSNESASRVWKAIEARGGDKIAGMVHGAFLSEIPGIETDLWHYLRKFFAAPNGQQGRNLLDENVHAVYAAAEKTAHEAHRFQGFVRFQKAPDGSLFSVIAPDHNILQILSSHFRARYPGAKWMIADSKRGLCLMGEHGKAEIVRVDPAKLPRSSGESGSFADASDRKFQDLWLSYYDAINIEERRNIRQMTRLMPRKYWQYLPERQARRAGFADAALVGP